MPAVVSYRRPRRHRTYDRLLVASHRLPAAPGADGELRPATEGPPVALRPLLRATAGEWFGWVGTAGEPDGALRRELARLGRREGYALHPIPLSQDEIRDHDRGFCDQVLWPFFHDLPGSCNFDPAFYEAFRTVDRRYAAEIVRQLRPGDVLWVHDHQLLAVATELRRRGTLARTGYFLHSPFPPLDIYRSLPWRDAVLDGLLAYDLVGFQTSRDAANFAACVRALRPGQQLERLTDDGAGPVSSDGGPRPVRVGAFPLGVDFAGLSVAGASPATAAAAQALRSGVGGRIVLGVDRLDPAKGLPLKLRAFDRVLERWPDLIRRVTLVQVVVPSRERQPSRAELKREIERLVGEINGRWSHAGWQPVRYLYRELPHDELLAWYRAADVALVTPIKEGMNLIAKEYCAAHPGNGALVLSEFAGAAAELAPADGDGALAVNPYDLEATAEAIHTALSLPDDERQRRMQRMRSAVAAGDVHRWAARFLAALPEAPSAQTRELPPAAATAGSRRAPRPHVAQPVAASGPMRIAGS